MKKFNKLQEDSERQFNELRNIINEQKSSSLKRIKWQNGTQQILELKNSVKKMNALQSINNRADQIKERANDLENRDREIIQKRIEILDLKKWRNPYENYQIWSERQI